MCIPHKLPCGCQQTVKSKVCQLRYKTHCNGVDRNRVDILAFSNGVDRNGVDNLNFAENDGQQSQAISCQC